MMIQNVSDVAQYLADERKAGELIERLRWSDGIKCPYCSHSKIYETKGPNLVRKQWKCGGCRKKFSVTTRSIFEGSHIKLGYWIYAIYKMCVSKKGVSAHQLHRELGITYKSAWFMCHRIRYAMTQPPLKDKLSGVVEVDETYIGPKKVRGKTGRGAGKKAIVVALIERDGRARTFKVPDVKARTLKALIGPNVAETAHIMTDSWRAYSGLAKRYAGHGVVNHSREYVRGIIHTNFAESYFSLLKRGLFGTFHHVSEKHLPRYLREFEHRWNMRHATDGERTVAAIRGAEGKRRGRSRLPGRRRGLQRKGCWLWERRPWSLWRPGRPAW